MKYRKLTDGKKVVEASESVAMTIDSKCPKKWAFVDMETGDIWVHKSRTKHHKNHSNYDFWAADGDALLMVRNIAAGKVVNQIVHKIKRV